MSVQAYQKILQVSERLLEKIDLPQDTRDKYFLFKSTVLEEDSNEEELFSQLKDEQIAMYESFVAAAGEVLQDMGSQPLGGNFGNPSNSINPAAGVSGISSPALGTSENKDTSEILTTVIASFVDTFNRKKKIVKDSVNSSLQNCSTETKLKLQRLWNNIEGMEGVFDKIVTNLATLDEKNKDCKLENSTLTEKVCQLEKELDQSVVHEKDIEILTKELKIIKIERDDALEKLKSKETEIEELQKDIEISERELGNRIVLLEKSQKMAVREAQEFERVFDRLTGFFKPIIEESWENERLELAIKAASAGNTNNQDQALSPPQNFLSTSSHLQPSFPSTNLPKILDIIEDFVSSLYSSSLELKASLARQSSMLKKRDNKRVMELLGDAKELVRESSRVVESVGKSK